MTDKNYTVKGRWPFPLDMLRHDGSRPVDADAHALIVLMSGDVSPEWGLEEREITLTGPHKPNTARWESFGWTIPADREWAMIKDADSRTGTCIGGPKDGETVTIYKARSFQAMVGESLTPTLTPGDPRERMAFHPVVYHEGLIQTDRGHWRLWVLEGLSTHEALGRLIQRYEETRR